MAEVVLQTKELTKAFGSVVAVNNFNLELHKGEVLGLLGVNGAGKTTFMQMLLGLLKPTSGTIDVFGQEFEKNRIAVLQRMNFSSTYANLPNNLSVWQNLYVFAKVYGVRQPKQKIEGLLELLEISDLAKRLTGHLSAGESTRVNLCKALLNDPELLLLDEPTASLDPDIADKVRTMIKQIQRERGISMLYTSHNMQDIEAICERIVFIDKGKKLTEGTAEQILAKFKKQSLEEVFIHIARDMEREETV